MFIHIYIYIEREQNLFDNRALETVGHRPAHALHGHLPASIHFTTPSFRFTKCANSILLQRIPFYCGKLCANLILLRRIMCEFHFTTPCDGALEPVGHRPAHALHGHLPAPVHFTPPSFHFTTCANFVLLHHFILLHHTLCAHLILLHYIRVKLIPNRQT